MRIPARVLLFLEGTHAWRHGDEEPISHALFRRIQERKPAKDGSVTITVGDVEKAVLWYYADLMADSYSPAWDAESRAEVRAAQAVIKATEPIPVTE